ncbi:ethanolamine ammonia-lyase subunit EutC [Spirosoma sordidisoli]|uniref:Ethanolamine ammonia-lyase small subunit n=1 Tax=Spirosoma sordidisoli TaxID=2502893 RepID=A0A4Q2ULC1_9BACT|nr:ethanolamine ammonia-lyase subunit EutC [Spirosoma sordidisoli]RYC70333.1 ethanolamine ammonia-lyase subunit EutC [Spirosoma sordidisoli]
MNADPWSFLQAHTRARIAQGRVGNSLPTRALLDFQLDHARARDAVYSVLDEEQLLSDIRALGAEAYSFQSQAADRAMYLKRPDLGRRLHETSVANLTRLASDNEGANGIELAIVIVDGLSATAVNTHAVPVVSALLRLIRSLNWSVAPICLVQQGRVAIGDEIAHALGASMVLVLIGERPGLSSPDSLGAYLTYKPRPGLTDESRNCVSNIRPEGLPYEPAAQKLAYLLTEMKTRQLSGVGLKDEMPTHTLPNTSYPVGIEQTPETPD